MLHDGMLVVISKDKSKVPGTEYLLEGILPVAPAPSPNVQLYLIGSIPGGNVVESLTVKMVLMQPVVGVTATMVGFILGKMVIFIDSKISPVKVSLYSIE